MKQKERRELNVSPNNLIVPSWSRPISKRKKNVSVVSVIVFAICLAILIAFEANMIILTAELAAVIVLIMGVTCALSLVAPMESLINKMLRNFHNAETAKELLKKGYDL